MSEEINEEKKTEETSSSKTLFAKTLKQYLDKSVEVSKKGLKSAGSAISEFGDKSVNKIDIVQLKNRLVKKYQELGQAVAEQLAEDGISISKDSIVVSEKLPSAFSTSCEPKVPAHAVTTGTLCAHASAR